MNKNVFNTKNAQNKVAAADTVNEAGGVAYALTPEAALAQYVLTGCLNNTYYIGAETQVAKVLELAQEVDPVFVAKLATYARKNGFMKDTPALLVAYLFTIDTTLFKMAFRNVIDDFKMLRNFVQIVRSGAVGRKSFGTAGKTAIQKFLDSKDDSEIFRGNIGNDPSLTDILRMVHPRPKNVARRNLYSYILGREFDVSKLPEEAQEFEAFKANPTGTPPEVNFQLLSSIKMSPTQWASLVDSMSWHTLRMNLNTLARNGAFEVKGVTQKVANKLADADTIRRLKLFPYQILTTYQNVGPEIPNAVKNALQDALEIAVENVPSIKGDVVLAIDNSGSMGSPVTGNRGSATTATTCVDVAGLIGAAVLRKNPTARALQFTETVREAKINGRDSVLTNAQRLVGPSGGTDCSAPLQYMNAKGIKADLVFMVSDNESWVQYKGHDGYYRTNRGTGMAHEWAEFKKRNPKAKLVLLDIQPGSSTQAKDDVDVLNLGGFSDRIFDVVADFVENGRNSPKLVDAIKAVKL